MKHKAAKGDGYLDIEEGFREITHKGRTSVRGCNG
jgi:hypothetical protein